VENLSSIYTSLDSFTSKVALENFKKDNDQTVVAATKQFWFTVLPQMLLFQLQRVKYSKEVCARSYPSITPPPPPSVLVEQQANEDPLEV